MKDRLLRQSANVVSFSTLILGVTSIVLSIEGHLIWAGVLILIGVLTDAVDGPIARATRSTSEFGRQLDSLVDNTCFGVGSCAFVYQYLRLHELSSAHSLLLVLPVPMAGVFRLARFNMQPVKTGREGSTMGLTIPLGAAVLVLAGLSGLHHEVVPPGPMLFLPLAVALLMASRIEFPSLWSVTRRKKTAALLIGGFTLLSIRLSPQLGSLTVMLSYLGYGVARAGYLIANRP
jgi:CDP-diacylglycerol---serine O-phosphatidyltransferase